MAKIFGTDGVRGIVNKFPMTTEMALKIGMAAAIHLGAVEHKTNKVIIGKDTRLSGYMIESALTAGLTSMGKDVFLVGPIPTPAVAMLTRSIRADMGIMISASHNPHYDNGIKLFDSKGKKLSDEDEDKIIKLMSEDLSEYLAIPEKIGRVERLREAYGRYTEFVKTAFDSDLTLHNVKIVVDGANGSAYKLGPTVMFELGATVIALGNQPNGLNINDGVGSTHIEHLRQKVLEHKADIGIAFDGDADRIIMVDELGNVIDGDKILAVLAVRFKAKNMLKNNIVVGTIMANAGLENYLSSIGVSFIRTKVGDRYVIEGIESNNASLGGEQSGHILLPQYNTTGDALIVALTMLSIMVAGKHKASDFYNIYDTMPQLLKNVTFNKDNPLENAELQRFIGKVSVDNKNCRILVRKSGTEKLIRVMAEGADKEEIKAIVDSIINEIKKYS